MPRMARKMAAGAAGGGAQVTIDVQPQKVTDQPSQTGSGKQNFWEAQEILLGPTGKEYVTYLYRLQPMIAGHRGYIAKFAQPVTQEEIKEQFGGYEYRISLHKGNKWITDDVFQIAAPPKLPGVADWNMVNNAASGGAPASGEAEIAKRLLESLEKRLEQERVAKKDDPAYLASLEMVKNAASQSIQTVMQSLPRQPSNPVMDNMMVALVSAVSGMFTKMMDRTVSGPQADLFSSFDKFLALVERVGGKGSVSKDPMVALGDSFINAAPRILEAAGPLMERYLEIARLRYNAALFAQGQRPPGAPPAQPVAAPAMHPQPPAAPAASVNGAHAGPLPVVPFPAADPSATAPAPAAGAAPDFNWFKQKLVHNIARGFSGESLMDWIAGTDENMALTIRGCNEAELKTFFAADPILQGAINLPNFDQCIREALEYAQQNDAQPAAATLPS